MEVYSVEAQEIDLIPGTLQVDKYFEYGYPPQRFGSEQMIWQATGRKVRGVNRGHNRRRRRDILDLQT